MKKFLFAAVLVLSACKGGEITTKGEGQPWFVIQHYWNKLTVKMTGQVLPLPDDLLVVYAPCPDPKIAKSSCYIYPDNVIFVPKAECSLVLHELTHFGLVHITGDIDLNHSSTFWFQTNELIKELCPKS